MAAMAMFVQKFDHHLALNIIREVPNIKEIFSRNSCDGSFVTEVQKYLKNFPCHI